MAIWVFLVVEIIEMIIEDSHRIISFSDLLSIKIVIFGKSSGVQKLYDVYR